MLVAEFMLIFFSNHAQILALCETVPHPKLVNEMPETSAYPLNAINIRVFTEKTTTIFSKLTIDKELPPLPSR